MRQERWLSIHLFLDSLLIWLAVLLWMTPWKHSFFFPDDLSRMVLSLGWAKTHFIAPADYYWLPAPFYFYGFWHQLFGRWMHLTWYLPATLLLMATGAWGLQQTVLRLKMNRPEAWPGPGIGLISALALGSPMIWKLAVSGMSEPLNLALQSLLILAMIACIQRQSRFRWFALLLLALVHEMVRYEAWPLSFLAWMLACLFAPVSSTARLRRLGLLLAGWAALAAFPLAWMAGNLELHGSCLNFIRRAQMDSLFTSREFRADAPALRMGRLFALAWGQGWWILLAGVAGAVLSWRDRACRALALYALAGALVYLLSALNATTGGVFPQRFCICFIWAMIPLAVLAFCRLWALHPFFGPVLISVFLGLLIVNAIFTLNTPPWNKHIISDAEFQDCLALHRISHQGYLVVLEEVPKNSDLNHNLMRFYVGLEKAMLREWYHADRPTPGRFLYLVRGRRIEGLMPAGTLLNCDYYFVDRMPPAGS